MVLTGMFTAVLAVLAQITIPMPSGVPVTLQTFAVALTGYVLGWKTGTAAVLVYLLIGLIGLPVFAGFRGGPGVLFDKTGGFLVGFLFMAALCGLTSRTQKKSLEMLSSFAGLIICHFLGTLQFSMLTGMDLWGSAVLVSLPYLPKDILFMVLAYVTGKVIKKSLRGENGYLV